MTTGKPIKDLFCGNKYYGEIMSDKAYRKIMVMDINIWWITIKINSVLNDLFEVWIDNMEE